MGNWGLSTYLTNKSELISGIKAELPILIGVIPFGLIYGVMALAVGMPASTAQAMSAIVFAGSSQFVSTQLIKGDAPVFVILMTVAIVNLRHALYSASLAPFLKPLKPAWKWALAYLLTDEAYAVSIVHYNQDGENQNKHWFFLGAGLALWMTWQLSTAAGLLLGAVVPSSWSLDFTLTLTFLALMVPTIRERASFAAAISAGVVAVLLVNLPYRLGLVIATLVGILVGSIVESKS